MKFSSSHPSHPLEQSLVKIGACDLRAQPTHFLQATLDSLRAHIAILNEKGVVISVNAAWRFYAKNNGFKGQGCGLGADYLEICQRAVGDNSKEAPVVLQGIKEVLSGARDEFYLEYPCHSPQEQHWFALRATRFNGDGDGDSRVVVSHDDISARKTTELRLREETELTETLYHVGQVVAAELNLDKVIEAVTEAAVELCSAQFGLFLPAPERNLGAPYAFSSQENLDLSAILAQSQGIFDRLISSRPLLSSDVGDDRRFQNDCKSAFGALEIASYLAIPVTSRTGERLGGLFLGHRESEIFGRTDERLVIGLAGQAALALENARLYESAKREREAAAASEQHYRFVTESLPNMVWITLPNGDHDFFNRQWYDYTGLSQSQSFGPNWANSLHPDDVERSQSRWRFSLESGEDYEIEYRLRRHDGVFRWFLGRALPLRDENGQILKWFGTCTDIDDQKRAQSERQALLKREAAARAEAENLNRLKDEFLAVVSHELRTPLTPILGWVEMLREEQDDPVLRRQAIEVIERNARAQSQIINDLLDISRIISGKMMLNLAPLDLCEVVASAIETCEGAAHAKGVHIERDLPIAAPSIGDCDRLRQVVWNLVSNAVKFTPRGGKVGVRLQYKDSALVLEVEDSGAGLDAEYLPFVFQRFSQADASSTRKHGGLGLGLSIVRHLVEQHGGEVSAHSPGIGQGACFQVRLPISPLVPIHEGEDETATSQSEKAFAPGREALKDLKIVLVDDEADAREMLAAALSRHGARVQTASSVEAALELIAQNPPDLLVSDIEMPGEDGYSLIRRVRALPTQNGAKIPAVALTAFAHAEDRARALAAGFQTHLAKPAAPGELVMTLAALAGRLG